MWRPVVTGTLVDCVKAGGPLTVGVWAQVTKPVQQRDVVAFARLLGDDNPIHVNEDYAVNSRWKGRIAHGMLSSGLIGEHPVGRQQCGRRESLLRSSMSHRSHLDHAGTLFGCTVPGSVYVSQTLRFRKPVPVGDTVTAHMRVAAVQAKPSGMLATCDTSVRRSSDNEVVIDGQAVVLLPTVLKPMPDRALGSDAVQKRLLQLRDQIAALEEEEAELMRTMK